MIVDTPTLLVYVFATLLLLFWISEPILARPKASLESGSELARERIGSLLKALKNLYRNKSEQDSADGDFSNIERRLVLELAKIYHDLGIDPKEANTGKLEPDAKPEKSLTAKPKLETKPTHETADAAKFCVDCGRQREKQFRFCPRCGAQFRAA